MDVVGNHAVLDDMFSFVVGNSACEPVTPFRLALYLLIQTLDSHHRLFPFTSKQLVMLSSVVFALLRAVNLSYVELCSALQTALGYVDKELFVKFKKSVDEHRGPCEVLISREEIFHQPRRSDRIRGNPMFHLKSLVGIFIRKLAIARARQSASKVFQSHKQWLAWLEDIRPTAGCDLFGDYGVNLSCEDFDMSNIGNSTRPSADVVDRLTPRMEEIHLSVTTTPIKDRSTQLTEELILAATTPRTGKHVERPGSEPAKERTATHCKVFEYEPPAPTPNIFSSIQKPYFQPQLSELLSSGRAKTMLEHQIHLLHVSPSEAMSSPQLLSACDFIKSYYPDLPLVYLVEMMDALRSCNGFTAENRLRQFFDWTTIRVNEISLDGSALTSVDLRRLRYAPLLNARLARLFNQSEHAVHLLTEAVQQAQINRDMICLRLAFIEQGEIEVCVSNCEDAAKSLANQSFHTAGIFLHRSADTAAEDDFEVDNEPNESLDNQEDSQAFIRQLKDFAALQKCIRLAKSCNDHKRLKEDLQKCMGADYGPDREVQSRLMSETAKAFCASLKLANGFVQEAISDSETLLYFNMGDQWCQAYNTEAQVIAGVTRAYAFAVQGKYKAALQTVEILKRKFPKDTNLKCANHWLKCEAMIQFDWCLLSGRWVDAESWIVRLSCSDREEAVIRKAVLVLNKGDVREAIELVRKSYDKVKRGTDFRLRLRFQMTYAMLLLYDGLNHVTRSILEECLSQTKSHRAPIFEAVILRRLAYVDVIDEHLDDAMQKIEECEWQIRKLGSRLENCLLNLTRYLVYRSCVDRKMKNIRGKDVNEKLVQQCLAAARKDCGRSSCPLLEKYVLSEAADFLNICGDVDGRDLCAIAFHDIDKDYPGIIRWAVL